VKDEKKKGLDRYQASLGKMAAFERRIVVCFLIFFIFTLLSQAFLSRKNTMDDVLAHGRIRGSALEGEHCLYQEGILELRIEGKENPDIKVLINGEEAGAFEKTYVALMVKNGDIIEIDGNYLDNPVSVTVVSKSGNIASDVLNKSYVIGSGIKRLFRVQIE